MEMSDKLQNWQLTSSNIENPPGVDATVEWGSGAKFAIQIILIPDAYAGSILSLRVHCPRRSRGIKRHIQCKHTKLR